LHGFDPAIEKQLLAEGIISFEGLVNLEKLRAGFVFYGMPLHIRDGEGSPVRAFAVVEE
jgi:kynurenine formamidase